MPTPLLLWADDEIEMLRAHIIFLEKKGYRVITVASGLDAIEQCRQQHFDLVLLDEMMPGQSGLETLEQIKDIAPETPVVMVTKSEEEDIMNQAIGRKIADYLIKPVNPNQILLTLKKNIHRQEIVSTVTQTDYQQSFTQIGTQIADCRTWDDWTSLYRRLVQWEIDLTQADSNMAEMLQMQKEEANAAFAKYIKANYLNWTAELAGTAKTQAIGRPLMSPEVMKTAVFPELNNGRKVWLIVLDNFRYDQWRTLAPELGAHFDTEERLAMSILPTATQYARNAIFSGLMPDKIKTMFPELWIDEDDDEGKNINEDPLIQTLLQRYRRHETYSYHKLNDSAAAERLMGQMKQLEAVDLNVVVFNFIDMLSHARTESKMVRELAADEAAYRSITLSWFRHSVIAELLRRLAQTDATVIITTDHGSIRVGKPVKIIGERSTNTNLRYKLGRNLSFNDKDVFVVRNPKTASLPAPNISTAYVFATGDEFFAYPNNYNHYVQYYRGTFQHGGISMEEMIIPLITLRGKKR